MKFPLSQWLDGLAHTRNSTFKQISALFSGKQITPETWDELDMLLIQSDVGFETSQVIITNLQQTIKSQGLNKNDFSKALRDELLNHLIPPSEINVEKFKPFVILIVGVNGSGKTTTIAKLAHFYQTKRKRVLLSAADTFRAAADDQLRIWANRMNIPIINGEHGSDPGAVVFNSIHAAISRKVDILIVDTAGRLHTRHNLMEELKKIVRVAGKAMDSAPHATWLVIDSVTGQNALSQATYYNDAVKINGVILAKMDLSAKGGMAFAIQDKLKLPILFAGLGEKMEDLQPFFPETFVDGILNSTVNMES